MMRDAKQTQHVEAGRLWFRVRLTLLPRHGYVPGIPHDRQPGRYYYATLRQPVTDRKVAHAASVACGRKLGAQETTDSAGLLIGKYKIAGAYTIFAGGSLIKRDAH